jgi:tetratricopeptide (TPR) repeat protein
VLILDPRAYDAEAQRILAGGSFPEPFYQAPLYAYFLAAIYAIFGRSFLAVRIVQVLLGAASVVLTADLAGRLFGRAAGLAAAALALLYGVVLLYEGQIMKTTLTIFLSVALLRLLEPARRGPIGDARSALAGLVLGLGVLTRENLLLFVPAAAAALFLLGRTARAPLVFAAAALAAMAPATIHNLRAGGELILVTSQGGQNFYIGNHRGATGSYANPPFVRPDPLHERADFHAEAERREGRRLSATEVSDFWYLEAMREMFADPGRAARLLGRKALLFLGGVELPDNESLYAMRDEATILRALPLSFAVLVPLAALGAFLSRAQWRDHLLLHLFVAVNAVTLILFFVVSRYRAAVAPALMVFAGAALVQLGAWARERRARPLAASGALLVAAMAPLSIPDVAGFDPRDYGSINHHLNRADMYGETGRAEEAIAEYRAAIALNPDIATVRYRLGRTLVDVGRVDEARAEFERAIAIQPSLPDAHNGLGILLAQRGETRRAEEEFVTASRLYPSWVGPLENLARLYEMTGDAARRDAVRAAIAKLRPAASAAPPAGRAP